VIQNSRFVSSGLAGIDFNAEQDERITRIIVKARKKAIRCMDLAPSN